MPFDNRGHFYRVHKWEDDRKNKIAIMSNRHDEEDDNFCEGLSNCLLKDGRSSMIGNLNMGNFQIKNLADGAAEGDAVNLSQLNQVQTQAASGLKSVVNSLIPVGTIISMLLDSNHNNWLLCDGQEVSRTEYEELFALIGTRFGVGDGTTTFNLPDYRGKFLRGLGGNSASDIYTTQAEGLPNISGSVSGVFVNNSSSSSGALSLTPGENVFNVTTSSGSSHAIGSVSLNAASYNALYGVSAHVTPINQAINFFVKAKGE